MGLHNALHGLDATDTNANNDNNGNDGGIQQGVDHHGFCYSYNRGKIQYEDGYSYYGNLSDLPYIFERHYEDVTQITAEEMGITSFDDDEDDIDEDDIESWYR